MANADDIKRLESIDRIIADKYASRGKRTSDEMLAMMKSNPWLTASQCKEYGLVDEIIEEKAPSKAANEMVSAFRNCSIPMPEDGGLSDERSFFQKLAEFLGVHNKAGAPTPTPPDNTKNTIMNKKFTNVNTLLKVEGFDECDTKVTLTTTQLQTIEDHLAELQGKVENNGNLEKQVSEKLDKFSEEVKNTEGLDAKLAKIKDAFDKIPAPVQQPAGGTVADEFADIRKDPVNNFLDE